MTDSLLDAAERKAHDSIEPIYGSGKGWRVVGKRDAYAAIRDLRREAFRAGERAMRERAAEVCDGVYTKDEIDGINNPAHPLFADDIVTARVRCATAIRALAEAADGD